MSILSGEREGQTAGLVAGFGAAAISFVTAYFHLHPYRFFAELQADVLGGRYYPALTFLIVLILFGVPLRVLAGLALGNHQSQGGMRFAAYAGRYRRHFQLSLAATMAILVGAFMWIRSLSYGPLTEVTLAQLEDQSSSARFVRISGYEFDEEWGVEDGARVYLPLRSPRPGGVFVVAELSERELSVLTPGTPLGGLLREDGMPNEVRVYYEDAELLAPGALTLELNETPLDHQYFGLGLLILGLFGAAGAGFYYFSVVRHAGLETRSVGLEDPADPLE